MYNELNEDMQHLGKNYNTLLVNHKNLMKTYEDVINEMDNDWKQEVEKIPKSEMKRHFEML